MIMLAPHFTLGICMLLYVIEDWAMNNTVEKIILFLCNWSYTLFSNVS